MNDRFTVGRALSGGAVIVGSILLAFAIDAGWDAYRERADEQAVLASLEAEFVSNLETLERVIRRHEGFADRAAELEAMSDDEVRAIPAERIEEFERAMGQWMTFEPRGGVLSSLVGDAQERPRDQGPGAIEAVLRQAVRGRAPSTGRPRRAGAGRNPGESRLNWRVVFPRPYTEFL